MPTVLKHVRTSGYFGAVAITIGRQVVAMVLQIFVALVIARDLGASGQGVFSLALAFQQLAALVLSGGFGSAKTYFSSFGAIDDATAHAYEKKIIVIASGTLAAAVCLLYLLSPKIIQGMTLPILVASSASAVSTILLEWSVAALLAKQAFTSYNKILLGQTFCYAALVGLLYFSASLSVATALTAYISSNLAAVVYAKWIAPTAASDPQHRNVTEPATLGAMLRYGSKNMAADAVTLLNYRMSFFASNAALGNALTGLFALAVSLVEKLWVVSQGVATVILPKMAAANRGGQAGGATINLPIAFAVMGVTLLGGGALLIVLSQGLLQLLGTSYAGLIGVTVWLLPGCIAWAGVRVIAAQISAFGAPQVNLMVTIACFAINVAQISLLFHKLDAVLMAKISSASYTTAFAVIFCYALKFNRGQSDAGLAICKS